MKILVALVLCSIQCIPLEGQRLAPLLLPLLSSPLERAKFLQEAAASGDVAFIGFIHKSDPLAWASGDGWRCIHGTTALHAAAESRDALAVRALIALGADVAARDAQGRSPLHITARSDAGFGATRELLVAGAEVDATDVKGVTPLMEAVRHYAHETVRELLKAGADPTKTMDGGFSVVTQALQKHGVSGNDALTYILDVSPLSDQYSYQCDSNALLREEGIRSRYLGSISINSTDSLFRTYLHKYEYCDSNQQRQMVNARDLFNRTPLHNAVMGNRNGCVKKLLDLGADREAVDWLKRTPLRIAQLCKFREIEGLLNSQAQL